MKTIYDLKNEIKELASAQKELKAQRREKYEGKRTMSQNDAAWQVFRNKKKLRIMHIAYSFLRGWAYKQIEPEIRKDNYAPTEEAEALAKEYNSEETVHFSA